VVWRQTEVRMVGRHPPRLHFIHMSVLLFDLQPPKACSLQPRGASKLSFHHSLRLWATKQTHCRAPCEQRMDVSPRVPSLEILPVRSVLATEYTTAHPSASAVLPSIIQPLPQFEPIALLPFLSNRPPLVLVRYAPLPRDGGKRTSGDRQQRGCRDKSVLVGVIFTAACLR
jgi:hypothetical protein